MNRSPTAGPLGDVRVLDLTHALAGPYGGLLLADLGADVIKIERPPEGDPARKIPPLVDGESTYFWSINRDKRSLVLDLRLPAGLGVFHDLVRQADVVLDNFRPGVTERLQIDYPRLATINPRIIACSISGFGQAGPYRDRPAFDLVIQAMSGAMSFTGEAGRPPVRLGLPMGDLGGGLFGALGVLAALLERERSGRGQLVDVSLLDGLIGMLTYLASAYFARGDEPQPVGSGHHNIVPYQAFAAADGYLVVAVFTDAFWANLCHALARPDLADDPRFRSIESRSKHRVALVRILEDVFRRRPRDEWLRALAAAGVPSGPIYGLGEALTDQQVLQRGMVVTVDHPTAGEVQLAGTPLRFRGAEVRHRPPPLLGQHTREVLQEVGRYSAAQVEALIAQGVVVAA